MNNWICWGTVEEYLESKDIELSFNEFGLVGIKGKKVSKLDIYSMKNYSPDWESNPECKVEDVKSFLCVFYNNYNEIVEGLM